MVLTVGAALTRNEVLAVSVDGSGREQARTRVPRGAGAVEAAVAEVSAGVEVTAVAVAGAGVDLGAAAAWGEHRFGAGRGEPDLVVLLLDEGITGGVVVGGRLQRPAGGIRLGHVQVVPDGRECPCGQRGCWQVYVGGGATPPGEAAAWLGQGLADLAAALDPGVFVVGGAASAALVGPARAQFAAWLTGSGHRPQAQVRDAQLGEWAAALGAADLADAG